MAKRKRYNPLEESGEEQLTSVVGAPEDRLDAAVFDGVERIERLVPSQMMPDRFQPRRLLPEKIRRRFFDNAIDCYAAAQAWLELAEDDRGWEVRLAELLDMGGSFKEQGQINPITGAWRPTEEGKFVFQIETGERRFWAACLRSVRDGMEEEPELRVEVVAAPTRQRQVLENRHSQTPSAVGQACEIAALMLEEIGVKPDAQIMDEFEYFRLALARRAPRGMWARLEPVMQHSTRRMQQLLSVLQLSTPLLELADRYQLSERVLREVLALPKAGWKSAIDSAVREGLTSEEVGQLRKTKGEPAKFDDARRSPERIAFTGMRRFARAAMNVDADEQKFVLDGVADEVLVKGFGEALLPLLKGLSERIEVRLRGRF